MKTTTTKPLFLLGGATTLVSFTMLPWIIIFGRMSGYQLIQVSQIFSRGSNIPMTLLWSIPVTGLFALATGLYVQPAKLLGLISIFLSLISLFVVWNAMENIVRSGGVDYGFWVNVAGLIIVGAAGISTLTVQYARNEQSPKSSEPLPETGNLRAQFEAARTLIDSRQYDAARNLLKTIDHPKASEWLARLEKMQ